MVSTEEILKMKEKYPEGTRIRLIYMDDRQAPPKDTLGTVDHIDGVGGIHVRWDNGSGLSLFESSDKFNII